MLLNSAEFTPQDRRERLAAPILRFALRVALKPALSPAIPLAWQRWWLKQMTRSALPCSRVGIEPGRVGGIAGEWVRPRLAAENPPARAAILYLHGGAYCVGSPATHRALTSRLARAAGLPVFAADYRLAPEHPFPAAVEDAVCVYRSLMETGPVAVAGESAGGGLSLATTLAARQKRIDAPCALVLLSPWVDLKISATAPQPPKREAVLKSSWLDACARHYLAGEDAAAPLASPIYADLHGLPPTLIQAGADDLLLSEAVRIHDALRDAGVAVRCEIVPARWHAFQFHAGMLPSAAAALDRAGRFISLSVAS